MKRAEQQQIRRAEIMFKGLELFVKRGYAGTKTSDIAKELGISEGLVFHYFKTKEQLYYELVKIGVDKTELFDGDTTNPYEKLYAIVEEFLNYAKQDRRIAMLFVLVEEAQNNGNTPITVKELAGSVNTIEMSIPLIKAGQKDGIFRSGNTNTLAYTFWMALQGVMSGIARDDKMGVPDVEWIMSILKP